MKLIVGLGNPEEKYHNTRHNVGYVLIDKLKAKLLPSGLVAKKTGVFMNESGKTIGRFVEFYKVSLNELYVVCDDLDISLGEYKIQLGKGPKDHKGLSSVYKTLGTKDFWHVRVGIENRDKDNRISGEEYVLQDFLNGEKEILYKVIEEICKKLVTF